MISVVVEPISINKPDGVGRLRLAQEASASAAAAKRKTVMDGDIDEARAKLAG